ncbi:FAD-dependent monooxygenase [Paenibacillus sp. SSG-1]|uniref:FAD-dependent monooxygenase n=1 Tax=Paenibacillus sp. SSG-1 TaxID=1443669 RepID=UPI000B7DEBBC|nr:FAD-dependent monooxygenase [Paenibacillus sp. SSG-1]
MKDVPIRTAIQADISRLSKLERLYQETMKWMSRFGNATRQAGSYLHGRLFLAGDSAHIHFPAAIGKEVFVLWLGTSNYTDKIKKSLN